VSERLDEWVPLQLKPEREIQTIQLSAEGTIWETWGAPFGPEAEFLTGVKAVIAANAADSRKGRVNLLLTAIGKDQQIKSTCGSHCMGTNSAVDSLVGSGGGSAKAFSDAMQGQASLMNTLLKAAENMIGYVTKVNESLTEQIVDLTAYKHAMQQAEIAAKDSDSGVSEFLLNQVKELSPMAMSALNLFLESQAKSPAATAAKTGIAAVAQINGVKS
jgi:hypothetical protein